MSTLARIEGALAVTRAAQAARREEHTCPPSCDCAVCWELAVAEKALVVALREERCRDHEWEVGESGPVDFNGGTRRVATCVNCGSTRDWGEGSGVL